jgi:hypothetical protein
MRPVVVIIVNIIFNNLAQPAFGKNNEIIQTFIADGNVSLP